MMLTPISLADKHILIVDDNPNNLLLIELILQENLIKYIYKAQSSSQAFDILNTHPIDAILLDVMMPDIDGIQACKIIRANRQYDSIPIIMVTAIDDNQTFKDSFNAGADDFVPKPINDVVLLSRLRSQLEKHHMYKMMVEQSRFSAMDEIISILAHQWRQPLSLINAIMNNARVKIQLKNIELSEIENEFDKIECNLAKLSEMINNFKTNFSSSDIKDCTDVVKILDEVCEVHKSPIKELHIQIKLNNARLRPSLINKQSLTQVIIHLLKNCFDSFRQFPINQPVISVMIKEKGDYIILTIEDNGKGISKENLPHIFEPYFSTKVERNGKGLDLYFAKQLTIKQLEGTLHLTSQPGKTKAIVTIKRGELC